MQINSFNRKPYQIVYKDLQSGELQKLTRRPPEKLHDILPLDVVELTSKRNDDWQSGEEYEVKHVSYRQPNTVQLVNDAGEATFVAHTDLELVDEVAFRGKARIDDEKANRYLTWP